MHDFVVVGGFAILLQGSAFPSDVPFIFDAQSILSSEMTTDVGDIDLLSRILGVGTFAEVSASSELFEYEDLQFRVLSVDALIASKRAAGREKDRAGLIELQALKESREISQE